MQNGRNAMPWYKWLVFASIGWGSLAWAEVPPPPSIEMPESVPIQPSPPKPESWIEADRYHINGDGTVTDTKTGLMWKRCSEGQNGEDCNDGKITTYKWGDAMSKFHSGVSFAGHSNWRMPTREELRSLVYCSNGTPQEVAWDRGCNGKDNEAGDNYQRATINLRAFPNTPANWYWSSDEEKTSTSTLIGINSNQRRVVVVDNAWYVTFFFGYVRHWSKSDNADLVRLVRSR